MFAWRFFCGSFRRVIEQSICAKGVRRGGVVCAFPSPLPSIQEAKVHRQKVDQQRKAQREQWLADIEATNLKVPSAPPPTPGGGQGRAGAQKHAPTRYGSIQRLFF